MNSTHAHFNISARKIGAKQSRSQRLQSFWSEGGDRIATSGQVQHRKSPIHGLPVALRMLRVKSDKYDWSWSQSTYVLCLQSHSKPECRSTWPGVPISSAWQKGPLGARLGAKLKPHGSVCRNETTVDSRILEVIFISFQAIFYTVFYLNVLLWRRSTD